MLYKEHRQKQNAAPHPSYSHFVTDSSPRKPVDYFCCCDNVTAKAHKCKQQNSSQKQH